MLDKINEVLEPHIFPDPGDGTDPRLCPNCGEGRLSVRTARSGGAFIGCSNYPECRYTRPFGPPGTEGEDGAIGPDGKLLGEHDGDRITLRTGRFGPYVQRGEASEEAPKPPRASIPKGWSVDDLDLDRAVMLLSLPRAVGPHPEDGEPIEAGIGRYGPYVKHGRLYANLPDVEEVFTIGMNPRRRGAGAEGRRARRAGRGEASQGAGRASRGRRDRRDGGALRTLREVAEGQRDDPQGRQARGRHPPRWRSR